MGRPCPIAPPPIDRSGHRVIALGKHARQPLRASPQAPEGRTPFGAHELEPGRRIELLTYALREGLDACLAGSGDVSTPLTRPYRFRRRLVPVRGVHVYGMDMGCAVWWEANSGGDSARQREGTEGTRTRGHGGTRPTKCQLAGGSGLSRSLYRFLHLPSGLPF